MEYTPRAHVSLPLEARDPLLQPWRQPDIQVEVQRIRYLISEESTYHSPVDPLNQLATQPPEGKRVIYVWMTAESRLKGKNSL